MLYAIGNIVSPSEYHPANVYQGLRDKMGQIVAKTVQGIAQDREERSQHFQSKISLLSGGIWERSQYFKILKSASLTNDSAKQRLEWFKEKNVYDSCFFSPKLFNRIADPKHPELFEFCILTLKDTITPSQAMENLLTGREFSLIDCEAVCQIGQYKALLNTIGEAKFDKLFSPKTGLSLQLTAADKKQTNPLSLFLLSRVVEKREVGKRDIAVGQAAQFYNVEDYARKHRNGASSLYNTVCLEDRPGSQSFVGMDLSPTGATEQQILDQLLDDFNEVPLKHEDCYSQSFIKRLDIPRGYSLFCDYCTSPDQATKSRLLQDYIDLAEPRTHEKVKASGVFFGYKQCVIDFNIELIQQLVETPLEQISMQYVQSIRQEQLRSNRNYYPTMTEAISKGVTIVQ